VRIQCVLRWDSAARLFRLGRVSWDRGTVGNRMSYSSIFSLAFTPRLFQWQDEVDGWILTVLCLRFHRRWSWGGRFG